MALAFSALWTKFLEKAGNSLPNALLVVALAVALIVLIFVVRFIINRFPRKGTLVSFQDLAADDKHREDRNRELTSLVLSRLVNPGEGGSSGIHMDIMPGTTDSGFGSLWYVHDMVTFSDFVPSDHPIKFAGLEFGLRDFLGIFRRPHRRYLRGWVHATGQQATAASYLLNRSRRPEKGRSGSNRWRVVSEGGNVEEKVVAELTARIIASIGECAFTDNWESLLSFNEGIQAFQTRADCVEPVHAHRYFEEALRHDPSNWAARFYLALCLCRSGQSKEALDHLGVLRSLFLDHLDRTRSELESSKLRRYLKKYPECLLLVQYNEAIARSPNLHSKRRKSWRA